ncbi:MAG: hypothetical protein U0326_32905 [Polyangiales bacterium]
MAPPLAALLLLAHRAGRALDLDTLRDAMADDADGNGAVLLSDAQLSATCCGAATRSWPTSTRSCGATARPT